MPKIFMPIRKPVLPALILLSLLAFAGIAMADPAPPTAADAARQAWMLGPFVKTDAANPIIKPDISAAFDDPMGGKPVAWEHDHTFNPAAVVRDGKVYILFRAEDNSGEGIGAHTSRIGLAESADGLHFTVHPTPVLFPANDDQKPYDWTGGCEDPRIVETEDGGYVLLYTAWNHGTARLCAAASRDLVHWVKHGPVFAQADGGRFRDNYCKSGAIVTRRRGDHLVAAKIHGKYWMFFGEGTVSTATSDNLTDWSPTLDAQGNWKSLLLTRGGHFDSGLAEAGPPAVITAQGIVFLYNGKSADTGAYAGGEALMAADDPTKVLDRTDGPVIAPDRPYEVTGQYAAGTTFVEGLVHFGSRWLLYYGTADSFVAAAAAPERRETITTTRLTGPLPALIAARGLPISVPLNTDWQLQDAAKVGAGGEVVSVPGYKPSAWYKATVPGTVLTSLVNDGIYPEPLYGENNRPDKIPDSLCRATYWYRTSFTVPHSYTGKRVWLHFDGINYQAEIWVNGHDLGSIKGAFARGQFDVTPYAKPGQPGILAVQILPQPHPGTPVEQTIAAGVGPNGGETARDGPTFLCSIGWDWIPGIRDRNLGIWQGVSLSATGPVTLRDTYVTSDLPLPGIESADLTVQTTLKNVTGQVQKGVLVGTFGATTFRAPVTLAAGETQAVTLTPADIPALHVIRPRLWWPNGYGPQNLYTLHLRFVQGEGSKNPLAPNNGGTRKSLRRMVRSAPPLLGAGGTVSDPSDTTFGIRKITYSVPGSDNLTLSVNGVPVLCKGGDWGMDEAMKRSPAARLDAQVRMHQQANYTMIRNWVGQSTSEDFYKACDKYGILLWDEFFQPNPSDGPNPDDVNLYLANVREKILRFRSHPSIAVWCARNEGFPPPVIDAGIQKLMAELERNRLYQPSSTSGRGVNSGGPYYWRTPREYYDFGEPFKTEIGSVSIPTLESIQGMLPAKDWNVINDDWAEHDLAGGAQGGDWFPRTLASRYGPIRNLADFTRKGQLATYEAFRAMYEGREAKLFHPATGVLTWMSNPAQPSFVWQLYGWDLEPNAALFATRIACEPLHVQMNQNNWHVMVINNLPGALRNAVVKTSVYNLDGSLAYTHTQTVTAAPSAATDLGAVAFPENLSAVHFVKLELYDFLNIPLSYNFYWRETQQDNFQALNALPTVSVTCTPTRRDFGTQCFLSADVHNPSKSIALMTHLQLRNARTNRRILPVFYSDNYVSLVPGETRTITVEAARAALGGDQPLLVVDGWNVTVKPAPGIAANVGAMTLGSPVSAPVIRPAADSPLRINCGGSTDAGPFFTFGTPSIPANGFVADTDFDGGNAKPSGDTIDAHVPNAAPAFIYQSERWGPCAYTLPAASGKNYLVRLHFAETTYDAAGKRKFHVDINGKRVLTDFDVFAEAGGKDRAVVRDFPGIAADANGHIVIAFTTGSADLPKISGIEEIAE